MREEQTVKKKISILIAPLFLWACSFDPDQGVSGQAQPNAVLSGNEGIVDSRNEGKVDSGDSEGTIASAGSVVDMPVEIVNPGSSGGFQPGGGQAQPPPVAQAPDLPKGSEEKGDTVVPPVAQVPEMPEGAEENEQTVTPPAKITGAFLVGEVIPNAGGETGKVMIGIVARQDDIRLTNEPDRFALNWGLSADVLLENSIRLLPTKIAAYDRILEFDGTMEELESFQETIAIQLSVSEAAGAAQLESIVKFSLPDLFDPVDEELGE